MSNPASVVPVNVRIAEWMGWRWWMFRVNGVVTADCFARYMALEPSREGDRPWNGEPCIECTDEPPRYTESRDLAHTAVSEMKRRGLAWQYHAELGGIVCHSDMLPWEAELALHCATSEQMCAAIVRVLDSLAPSSSPAETEAR